MIFWVAAHPFLGLLCRGYNPPVLCIEALYKRLLRLFSQCRSRQQNPDFITLIFLVDISFSCVYRVPFLSLKNRKVTFVKDKTGSSMTLFFFQNGSQVRYFFQSKAEHCATLAERFAAITGKQGGFCLLEAINLV